MAGSVSNLVLGLLLYPLLSLLRRGEYSVTLRFAVWLLATVNLSVGLTYPPFSGVFGVGDWAAAIEAAPGEIGWRALEILFGAGALAVTIRVMARRLAEFSGNRFRLAWIPYFAAVIVYCSIGLRESSLTIILISVIPAPIIGQAALFLAPYFARSQSGPDQPLPEPIRFNAVLLGLAFLVPVAGWFLAPGVHVKL